MDDPTSAIFPLRMERLTELVISYFTNTNAFVGRWPVSICCTFSQSYLPFETWAQPKYMERRKQAAAA